MKNVALVKNKNHGQGYGHFPWPDLKGGFMEKKNKGIEIVDYYAEEAKIIKALREDYDIALYGYHTAVRDVKKKRGTFLG